jgi:hypothetical protein
VTEFLPPVPWAGPENTINCAVGHHVREGRWLKDSSVTWEYLKFMLEKGRVNGPRAYACWPAVSGHDYAAIERREFGYRVKRVGDEIVFEKR